MEFVMEKRKGCRAVCAGKEVVIFSSNDYLGLSAHPAVLKAAAEAAARYGLGTGGAPGTTGTTAIHNQLQKAVAAFKSRDNAVLFPSGFQANQALHQALDADRTVFYLDNRHHPSAVDGVRLAKNSKLVRFDHSDMDGFKGQILAYRKMRQIVSLPSVFTVDGDIAPLDKIMKLKQELGFLLVLDEAHASGCIGERGHGLEEHFNMKGAADFIMGTFSKALGSQGGFLAYNNSVANELRGQLRPREYSTSLSTVSAAAALAALNLVENDASIMNSLRTTKNTIIDKFKSAGLTLLSHESMVMLFPYDDNETLQRRLFEAGYLTITVKALIDGIMKNCLRITPMATHTESDIVGFVEAVKRLG
jgi:8-amino-7-oxononanoate synthase